MKYNCEIVKDLLPLYIDDVASSASRCMVEEHLLECPDCQRLLSSLKNDEVEASVALETSSVIARQKKYFTRTAALIGCIIAGIFMIPIITCFIVDLATGFGLSWFFIVLASLLVAASLTVVPLLVPKEKGLWTLSSFTLSLLILFLVCCLYTGGRWFFVAGSSVLFGLSVVFLPFAVRSQSLRRLLGNCKGLAVMMSDTILFVLMMFSISMYVKDIWLLPLSLKIAAPFILLAWGLFLILRYSKLSSWSCTGICFVISGILVFFAEPMISHALGLPFSLPEFHLMTWNYLTVDGNIKWSILLACCLMGIIFFLIGSIKRRNKK